MTASRAPIAVVAGILIEGGKVLVSQRLPGQAFPLEWEFPGGKVEPGETSAVALAREFREELGIDVEALGGEPFGTIRYRSPGGRDVEVRFYRARRCGGEPEPLEVADVRWVAGKDMEAMPFIPHNREIVKRLREELDDKG
jgi:8-oxo-dGTP diphosphatase